MSCIPADLPTLTVLADIREERHRQDAKWGEQNLPNGTGPDYVASRDRFRHVCQAAAADGSVTWVDVLLEEAFEAFAEEEPQRLREELVQVAAVATAWVEAIDRASSTSSGGGETAPREETDRA